MGRSAPPRFKYAIPAPTDGPRQGKYRTPAPPQCQRKLCLRSTVGGQNMGCSTVQECPKVPVKSAK